MHFDRGRVKLQSRTDRDCTPQFPELLSPQVRAEEAILDGEITVFTAGKPDFEATMGRYGANPEKLAPAVREKPARYFVWDILWLNGESLLSRPLMERKVFLEEVLEDSESAAKVDFVEGCGTDLFAAVEDLDLEGMVAKRRQSRYEAGRESRNWLKIKNYKSTAVDVVGVSKQDGALVVASDGKVVGHAIGMPAAERRELRELLPRLISRETRTTVWIEPVLKARVRFTTRTPRGNLRDCSFVEWVGFTRWKADSEGR